MTASMDAQTNRSHLWSALRTTAKTIARTVDDDADDPNDLAPERLDPLERTYRFFHVGDDGAPPRPLSVQDAIRMRLQLDPSRLPMFPFATGYAVQLPGVSAESKPVSVQLPPTMTVDAHPVWTWSHYGTEANVTSLCVIHNNNIDAPSYYVRATPLAFLSEQHIQPAQIESTLAGRNALLASTLGTPVAAWLRSTPFESIPVGWVPLDSNPVLHTHAKSMVEWMTCSATASREWSVYGMRRSDWLPPADVGNNNNTLWTGMRWAVHLDPNAHALLLPDAAPRRYAMELLLPPPPLFQLQASPPLLRGASTSSSSSTASAARVESTAEPDAPWNTSHQGRLADMREHVPKLTNGLFTIMRRTNTLETSETIQKTLLERSWQWLHPLIASWSTRCLRPRGPCAPHTFTLEPLTGDTHFFFDRWLSGRTLFRLDIEASGSTTEYMDLDDALFGRMIRLFDCVWKQSGSSTHHHLWALLDVQPPPLPTPPPEDYTYGVLEEEAQAVVRLIVFFFFHQTCISLVTTLVASWNTHRDPNRSQLTADDINTLLDVLRFAYDRCHAMAGALHTLPKEDATTDYRTFDTIDHADVVRHPTFFPRTMWDFNVSGLVRLFVHLPHTIDTDRQIADGNQRRVRLFMTLIHHWNHRAVQAMTPDALTPRSSSTPVPLLYLDRHACTIPGPTKMQALVEMDRWQHARVTSRQPDHIYNSILAACRQAIDDLPGLPDTFYDNTHPENAMRMCVAVMLHALRSMIKTPGSSIHTHIETMIRQLVAEAEDDDSQTAEAQAEKQRREERRRSKAVAAATAAAAEDDDDDDDAASVTSTASTMSATSTTPRSFFQRTVSGISTAVRWTKYAANMAGKLTASAIHPIKATKSVLFPRTIEMVKKLKKDPPDGTQSDWFSELVDVLEGDGSFFTYTGSIGMDITTAANRSIAARCEVLFCAIVQLGHMRSELWKLHDQIKQWLDDIKPEFEYRPLLQLMIERPSDRRKLYLHDAQLPLLHGLTAVRPDAMPRIAHDDSDYCVIPLRIASIESVHLQTPAFPPNRVYAVTLVLRYARDNVEHAAAQRMLGMLLTSTRMTRVLSAARSIAVHARACTQARCVARTDADDRPEWTVSALWVVRQIAEYVNRFHTHPRACLNEFACLARDSWLCADASSKAQRTRNDMEARFASHALRELFSIKSSSDALVANATAAADASSSSVSGASTNTVTENDDPSPPTMIERALAVWQVQSIMCDGTIIGSTPSE